MTFNIVLSGVGGQGVLSLAALVAQAALADRLNVRQSEIHGMAQRGGAVSAHLRLSDCPISGDLIPSGEADLILSMEPLESLRYLVFLKPAGRIVTAAEPVVNIPVYPDKKAVEEEILRQPGSLLLEIQTLARSCGSAKAANMVLVGAASVFLPLQLESLKAAMNELFKKKEEGVRLANEKAFGLGRSLAEPRRNP